MRAEESNKSFIPLSVKVKEKLKKFPLFYEVFRFILNPGIRFFPYKRNIILNPILSSGGHKVLSVASGYIKIPGVLNIDIYPYKGVDVISDAHSLSFRSEKFEAVILENILEHTVNPVQVVKESFRVLKKGGIIFVELPFLYEFHNSPSDYCRFTLPGIEMLLKDFIKIDSGISVGPTGTLNGVLRNYLAIIFSFNNEILYEFLNMLFGIIFFPLKFLDVFLVKLKYSHHISSILYFIGKK